MELLDKMEQNKSRIEITRKERMIDIDTKWDGKKLS